MDRNTVLGMVLIAIIIILTPFYMEMVAPIPEPQETQDAVAPAKDVGVQPQSDMVHEESRLPYDSPPDNNSSSIIDGEEQLVEVANPFYDAVISNKHGGSIVSYKLKNYTSFDSSAVNLIDQNNQNNLVVSGTTIDGDPFVLDHHWASVNKKASYSVERNDVTLEYTAPFLGSTVVKRLVFHTDSYQIDVSVDFRGAADKIAQGFYQIGWNGGLPITEKNEKDDIFYFKGYAFQGDDLNDPKLDKDENKIEEYRGQTEWVAVRDKYFVAAIIPGSPGVGASIGGYYEDKKPIYSVSLYQPVSDKNPLSLYLGPLEYKRIKALNVQLDRVMTMGWSFIRPISRGVLLLLTALHKYIPNYGFILILFSVLVKVVVYPLTKKSYQSTRKMQQIQPQITALREKHKNDPQKLNKATMELYKESGVNPMGGCLPLLLQMPLLFALFQVFRSTIEFRGAPFILWIQDLSAPDTLFEIGGFPINVLPLLMTVTMILQQTMMPSQPGQQKSMMYAMNVMFLFIFYRFPSGLNLYYTLFNLLTILQQKYLTPQSAAVPVASSARSATLARKKK